MVFLVTENGMESDADLDTYVYTSRYITYIRTNERTKKIGMRLFLQRRETSMTRFGDLEVCGAAENPFSYLQPPPRGAEGLRGLGCVRLGIRAW